MTVLTFFSLFVIKPTDRSRWEPKTWVVHKRKLRSYQILKHMAWSNTDVEFFYVYCNYVISKACRKVWGSINILLMLAGKRSVLQVKCPTPNSRYCHKSNAHYKKIIFTQQLLDNCQKLFRCPKLTSNWDFVDQNRQQVFHMLLLKMF